MPERAGRKSLSRFRLFLYLLFIFRGSHFPPRDLLLCIRSQRYLKSKQNSSFSHGVAMMTTTYYARQPQQKALKFALADAGGTKQVHTPSRASFTHI